MQISLYASFEVRPLQPVLEFWLRRLDWDCEVDVRPAYQLFQQLLAPAPEQPGVDVILTRPQDLGSGGLEELQKALQARPSRTCLAYCCPDGERPEGSSEWLPPELLSLYESGACVESHSELPFTETFYAALGTAIMRSLTPLLVKPIKLLVVDADNTLWDGVVAEDGLENLRVGEERRRFQAYLSRQVESGCLLAVCSKNHRSDVESVFERHPDMVLKPDQVLSWLVGWEGKSRQILALLSELNLGLESVLVLDDNAVEIAELRASGLQAIQVPEAGELLGFIQHFWWFQDARATSEDRLRAQFYRDQRNREQARVDAPGLLEFVAGLQLQIRIEPIAPEHRLRASQLTYRTNQFHLAPRSRSETECENGLGVWVSDRFGDYGMVGLLVAPEGRVETFLLSCRALGRGVEHAMLRHLAQQSQTLSIRFQTSERNQPAAQFLQQILGCPPQEGWNELDVAQARRWVWQPPVAEAATARKPESLTGACPELCRVAEEQWRAGQILAAARAQQRRARHLSSPYLAPADLRQQQAARVWEEVLSLEPVGLHDGFFELGGDSLAMVRVLNRLRELWGSAPTLDQFLRNPTVAALAEELPAETGPQPIEMSWVADLSDEEVEKMLARLESESSIESLAIPTAGRPQAVLRAVTSFHQHLREHGRPTPIVVSDQSAPAQSRETREMLSDLARQQQIDLHYLGSQEQQELRRDLVGAGFEPALIHFAFGGHELQGCGSNRNLLLLLGDGARYFTVDDDTLASHLIFGDLQAPVRYCRGREAEDVSYASESRPPQPGSRPDLLTLHETLLGRLGVELGDWPQLPAEAWVAATFNGLHGDCGLGAPFGIWEEPLGILALNEPSRQRLVEQEAHYRASLLSRRHLRLPPVSAVSDGACSLSTFMGLDATRLLPPWCPVLRGTDRVFPVLVKAILPSALLGHLPVAAPHEPLVERRFSPGELFRNTGGIDVSRLLLECIQLWEPGTATTPEDRLRSLGGYLKELARADLGEVLGPVLQRRNDLWASSLLESSGPAWWRDDVSQYLDRVNQAQRQADYWIPVDLRAIVGRDRAVEKSVESLRWLGELLQSWPDLLEAGRRRTQRRPWTTSLLSSTLSV
ncbi:MAG: HAD-IIIC family phosphatase [Candidatus Eremiobacteraeota bacterium]|nr:HAD-IIIC family phosphatase [Candidatus Eremiobacteraeota bacterium]